MRSFLTPHDPPRLVLRPYLASLLSSGTIVFRHTRQVERRNLLTVLPLVLLDLYRRTPSSAQPTAKPVGVTTCIQRPLARVQQHVV
jgi:hypothetical protein